MKFNYNTNGTFWIEGLIFICPHCGMVNPFQHGTCFCHNCRKVVNIDQNADFTTPNVNENLNVNEDLVLSYKNKKITEISQILEVLERNGLFEKDAHFDETKYFGKSIQIYARLTGWHITLIKE